MMKIQLYISLFLMTFALGHASHAQGEPRYLSTVSGDSLRVERGVVKVSFTLDLGERIVARQHKRVLTPVLVAGDGSREAFLPPVVAKGRLRAVKEQKDREAQAADAGAYRILLGNKPGNRRVDYHASLPYEPWMDNARLELREAVTGCNCGGIASASRVVAGQALYVPRLQPSAELPCPREFTPPQRAARCLPGVSRQPDATLRRPLWQPP